MKAVIKSTVNHPWRELLQMLWLCEPGGYIAIIGLLWGCCSAVVPGNSVNKKIGFHNVYICWLILWVSNIHVMMNSSSSLNQFFGYKWKLYLISFYFPIIDSAKLIFLKSLFSKYYWMFNFNTYFLPLCNCT